MTDIVERLKQAPDKILHIEEAEIDVFTLLEEAAAEITRLREALKITLDALSWETIGTYRMDDPDWYFAVDHAKSAARSALGEDKP